MGLEKSHNVAGVATPDDSHPGRVSIEAGVFFLPPGVLFLTHSVREGRSTLTRSLAYASGYDFD
ncbi:hypothetical protein Pla52o_36750 [Novipirellula galeiformis]|uniref:Uncharacterized protein n=1 Tax=Novipirellula galeiformis TaxID=2528004 RepID=A0A5C6CB89_9BACT|nr:hypothetical protein Pla52o_36750 [Novipirellula galeiformis]